MIDRADFPGIAAGDWARFDGPAGTQPAAAVIDAMAAWMRSGDSANSHGVFAAAEATDELVASARRSIGDLLGGDPDGVVFGPNTTTLLLSLTRSITRTLVPGDVIVCTRLDHDANVRPWMLAARDAGATVKFLDLDPVTGRLDVEPLATLCGEGDVRWVAMTGASNAIGTMPDVARAAAIAHDVGARLVVDAVHLVPHARVDVTTLGCDVLATSPYKWYGPHAGIVWATPDLLAELEPYKLRPSPDTVPERWETGTPSFEAIAGIEAAARLLLDAGMDHIADRERVVFAPLLEGLASMKGVTVWGPTEVTARTPTVAFNVDGVHPDDVARALAEDRIAVWSGDYYAVECMTALGLAHAGGAVRAGVVAYIEDDDVTRLLEAVERITRRGS